MERDSQSLEALTQRLIAFRDARDWRQFHSLKDLIVSLNLEAGELLELTQWKSERNFEREAASAEMRARLAEECADILLYLLLIAEADRHRPAIRRRRQDRRQRSEISGRQGLRQRREVYRAVAAYPERLEIVDELPMTPTRKIRKGELAKRVA